MYLDHNIFILFKRKLRFLFFGFLCACELFANSLEPKVVHQSTTAYKTRLTVLGAYTLFANEQKLDGIDTQANQAGAMILGEVLTPKILSFEIMLGVVDRVYVYQKPGILLVEKANRLHLTLGSQWQLGRGVSLGLGFYSSYLMGNAIQIIEDIARLEDANEVSEYGMDSNIRWVLSGSKFHFMFDVRHSLPLFISSHTEAQLFWFSLGFGAYI